MKRLTRRTFLRMLGGVAVTAAFPGSVFARAKYGKTTHISLFFTTDLHGHIRPTQTYEGEQNVGGLARCATQIKAWKKENPRSLVLDIGDVYQGTIASHASRGLGMIRCLNHLNYDAWVVGNHEFDWGFDTFANAIGNSSMPVLSSNAFFEGRSFENGDHLPKPLESLAPWIIRDIDGFRVAIVGLTTPGLPDWFPKATLGGFVAMDPVDTFRRSLRALQSQNPDAIILAAHMGTRAKGDNFANRIEALATEFPNVALIIGGHTHKNIPRERLGDVPYTQAGYFGIWAGRADLIFDTEKRSLIDVKTRTYLMDAQVEEDASILSLTSNDLKQAGRIAHTKIGFLSDTLEGERRRAEPSDIEKLIGRAVHASLKQRAIVTDGVFHGLFSDKVHLSAGEKTIGDMWAVIPFENQVVTARLRPVDLREIMEEVISGPLWDQRNLMGFKLEVRRQGLRWKVDSIRSANGQPLNPSKRYTIAFNSYDSVSGGRRFHKLADILRRSTSKTQLHSLQTREALIEFFQTQKEISRADLIDVYT